MIMTTFKPFYSRTQLIIDTCSVTFESRDKILLCNHSYEFSSTERFHGACTICFSILCKMKFGFFFNFDFGSLKVKEPVLSIMHCALQKSAAIFLMLQNPEGLIALCNPFASAISH